MKIEISPCCDAPSTNMTRIKSVRASDGQRRCVRCTNVFSCWIQVDDDQEEIMRIRGVGERIRINNEWKNHLKGNE